MLHHNEKSHKERNALSDGWHVVDGCPYLQCSKWLWFVILILLIRRVGIIDHPSITAGMIDKTRQ